MSMSWNRLNWISRGEWIDNYTEKLIFCLLLLIYKDRNSTCVHMYICLLSADNSITSFSVAPDEC